METLGLRQMLCWQIHCSSSEQRLENWDLRNPIDLEFAINNCELSTSVAAAGPSAQRKVRLGVRSFNGGVGLSAKGPMAPCGQAAPPALRKGGMLTSRQGLPFLSASSVLVYHSSQNQAQILCFLVKHACVSGLGRCVASKGVFQGSGHCQAGVCSKGDGELNWLPRRLKLCARASTQKPFSGMGLPPFTTVTAVRPLSSTPALCTIPPQYSSPLQVFLDHL